MKKKPEDIRKIVEEVMGALDKKRLKNNRVFLFWDEVVGKRISKHTKPLRVNKERLVVGVDGSVWLYHLSFFKSKILKGLQKRAEINIKEISFKVGKF